MLSEIELRDCFFGGAHPLDLVKIQGDLGKYREKMMVALTYAIDHVDALTIKRTSRIGTL